MTVAPASDAGGQLIRAGGQVQWVRCQGSGSPTVVLVSGLRADHRSWSKVLRPLTRILRTCEVDRPGLGLSPARHGSARTDAGRQAVELAAALRVAGEQGPYLLVGHSYGGLIVRAFTRRLPEQVAGVLLIDTVWPSIHRDFLPSYASPWHEGRSSVDLVASERIIGADFTFGTRPLVVIGAGHPGNGSAASDRRWTTQQRQMAALSGDGQFWVASDSGHVVQREDPAIVLRAVRFLRDRINQKVRRESMSAPMG